MQVYKKRVQTHLEENSSIYTFTMVLLVMGVVFGAIVVNSLALSEKQDLYIYLKQFFGQMSAGKLASAHAMFTQSFTHNLKYTGFIWILGLSVIGLPIILILLFLKGVVVGFTVGFLVNQMGWHGMLVSLTSVLPQNLLLIPAFVVVSTASISFSIKMFRQLFRKKSLPIRPLMMRYSFLFLGIALVLGIVSLFEAYVSPVIMKILL